MPVGNSGDSSFAHIAALPGGEDTARTFGKLFKQLNDAGADGAAQRFKAIDGEIAKGNTHFEDLERYIDPDRAVDELNSARGRVRWRKLFHGNFRDGLRPLLGFPKSVRYAHLLRNVAALAPLIFTWIMLGLAAQRYSSDLKHHPDAATKPFLLLWQQGFGGRFWSFEQVTVIDFILLALVVLLTFWVHWAEGRADRSADAVYEAMDSLKAVLADRHSIPTPLTPEQWARTASEVLSDTVQQTRELNAASERAIKEASDQLKNIQGMSREFLEDFQGKTHDFSREFKDAVLLTLTGVREQNEHFIENTRETNQQVLQALVEQQMQPLLNQVQDMLDQFRTQQVAYTDAVTDLTKSAGAIKASAAVLATSAQAFDGSTKSIAESLAAMASSQQRFASHVEDSAQTMSLAATAMTDVKDTLRTDLRERLQEMTGNITSASASLEETQAGLANTTDAMNTAAKAFAGTADTLAGTLREPMDMLRQALSQSGSVNRDRGRRFLFFRRRS